MQTSPPLHPADLGARPSRGAPPPQRRVVDAPTCTFHWLFALSFAGAYLTADGERWRALHVSLGYTFAALLACRVVYGLVGPRHARLAVLQRKLAGITGWWNALVQALQHGSLREVPSRQAQNLAMALAIALLLALAIPLTLSGYGVFNDWGDLLGGDWLEDVHEFFGNAMLATVLAHMGMVIGLSAWRRKNQARAMLTGRVDGPGPDLVKHNRAWLATLLLAGTLAFLGWRWQESPSGLLPSQGIEQARDAQHDDDD